MCANVILDSFFVKKSIKNNKIFFFKVAKFYDKKKKKDFYMCTFL